MDLSIYTHDSETLVKKNIVACRRCSNYIFILDLTPGFNGWGKDDCKRRRKSFKFGDLVRLILEISRYVTQLWVLTLSPVTWCFLRVSSAILPPTYIDEQMIFSSQQMLANINMAGWSMTVYIHGRDYMAVTRVLCGMICVTMPHYTLFKSLERREPVAI